MASSGFSPESLPHGSRRPAGFQTILFDLDGTLTDPSVGITRSILFALEKMGLIEEHPARLLSFIGPPLLESFRKHYCPDEASARRAVAYYRDYFSVTGLYENAVYPGIPRLLERLRAGGRRLVLATSKPTVFAEKILRHFALDPYFSLVVGSNLDGTRTEKGEVIGEALAQLGPSCAKESIVMVGDREHDVIGARAYGLACIGVTYGFGSPAELQAAGAAFLADSVEDLLDLLLSRD